MIWLILGVALWWAAHLFKRLAPDARASLGKKGQPIVAIAVVASVVLMIIGYRMADGAFYWGRTPAMVGINNLLMVAAFYIYGATAAKPAKVWIGRKIRHPQLTAFSIWAVAHLLVNGDVPSFVLFGGLLIWALLEMALINRQEGVWHVPPVAPIKKEMTLVIVTIVMLVVVMSIHYALGVKPWG